MDIVMIKKVIRMIFKRDFYVKFSMIILYSFSWFLIKLNLDVDVYSVDWVKFIEKIESVYIICKFIISIVKRYIINYDFVKLFLLIYIILICVIYI